MKNQPLEMVWRTYKSSYYWRDDAATRATHLLPARHGASIVDKAVHIIADLLDIA